MLPFCSKTLCGQRPRFSFNLEETQPSAQQGRLWRMTARHRARKHHKGCSKNCQFIYTGRQSFYCWHYNFPPKPSAGFANTIAGHFPSLFYITYVFLSKIGTRATTFFVSRQESKSRFIWAPSYVFFFFECDFTQDSLRSPVSPRSSACCCPGCATGIPTCFGNRQLPAIISQQTNVSWGFIASIGYFALHSPKSGPGISN